MSKYEKHIISETELGSNVEGKSILQQAEALRLQQLKSWEMAGQNYDSLSHIRIKELTLSPGVNMFVQHNPRRIKSTAAKVDAQSIAQRECFLCPEALPMEQKGLVLQKDYLLLINPFPIFEVHYTIALQNHAPQLMQGRIADMLNLAADLEGLTLFYNGAMCGASAPDHFHFQAIGGVDLPVFSYKTDVLKVNERIGSSPFSFLKAVSEDAGIIKNILTKWIEKLPAINNESEPRFNLLCKYSNKCWELILIPRTEHRPACFYAKGSEQILVSPASIDLGGCMIVPREKDYNALESVQLTRIITELTYNYKDLKTVLER